MKYIVQHFKQLGDEQHLEYGQWYPINSESIATQARAVEVAKSLAKAKNEKTRVLVETWNSEEDGVL